MGDPSANYTNVEITADNRYMVWFEAEGNNPQRGTVWHCGINLDTGDLVPPDCRGFRAFESTGWGRANPGYNSDGPYYVGADQSGQLIMVRPTGPESGKVTRLPIKPDPLFRAVYPTSLSNSDEAYAFVIRNERTPGAGVRPRNDWVELHYIDLNRPDTTYVIERQETPPRGFAPMDAGFARWVRGSVLLTYGFRSDTTGEIELRAFDPRQANRGAYDLVVDRKAKIDSYGAMIGGELLVFAGTNEPGKSRVYAGDASGSMSLRYEIFPAKTRLADPGLAQSHEPFVRDGRLYTVYQVNEKGRNFWEMTFVNPGEIWLADLSQRPIQQWLIAPRETGPIAEPEPAHGEDCTWIFFSVPVPNTGQASETRAEAPAQDRASRRRELIRERLGRRGTGGMAGGMRGGFPRIELHQAKAPWCD